LDLKGFVQKTPIFQYETKSLSQPAYWNTNVTI